MAGPLRSESHGRGDRGFPLGAPRQRGTARTDALRLDLRGPSRIHWGYNLFSADGRDNSRCYIGFRRLGEEIQTMSDVAIRVENLSKRYRIGQREGYLALRDVLARGLKAPFRLLKRDPQNLSRRSNEYIWALKDVSFEVKRGEVVGIIGRNGAGKTTLLKILSRITEPTEGYAEVRGRVGSLLEVGTGFHPELTGRENIYLNGAILGMKKREIDRKFDEIVAFAEVEKFIDTPVKYYSSGMYVRLAFAVAAHLEPEILLVDEVLAVGDIRFQRKCIGKMHEVSREGRTVLIVSHNMDIIRLLCQQIILLNEGKLIFWGDTDKGIREYSEKKDELMYPIIDLTNWPERDGSGEVRAVKIKLFHPIRGSTTTFYFGEPIGFEIDLEAKSQNCYTVFVIQIKTEEGTPVCDFVSLNGGLDLCKISTGDKVRAIVPENRFYPGLYIGDLWIGDEASRRLDFVKNCFRFEIIQGTHSRIERPLRRELGVVFQPSSWQIIHCKDKSK